jgi:glycerophosphoryl diester phosphodiesterase
MAGLLQAGWVVLLLLVAGTVFTAFHLLNLVQFEDHTGITAHRGSSITAPENTMAAILLAVEEGAHYVEIDVQETKDGVVVLCHDKDLKRVFDMDKGIWEVTYDEIKDLDSGSWFSPEFSDQRICTLDQVIDAVRDKAKLNIEMKFSGHEQKLAREVVRIVNANAFREQCILTSLDYAGLQRAQAADPKMRTGLIVTSAIGDITRLNADLLSVGAKSVNRSLVARAREQGLEVHVWTVNDVALMSTMIEMGVDQIITDAPKLLGRVLEVRAGLSSAEKVLLQLAGIAQVDVLWIPDDYEREP